MSQITIREGKGDKYRGTMHPVSIQAVLLDHLVKVVQLHDNDLQAGRASPYI